MKPSDTLLLKNKAWALERTREHPNFFATLAVQQRPRFLWIGCSDSRVPANQVTGTSAGELFVHRNVANQVWMTDLNLLSVMQYAVEVLKVEHIIVCGHYGCGGVRAAMDPRYMGGPISHWLGKIRDVHAEHYEEAAQLSPEERFLRLCEWNVLAQVSTLAKSSIVQQGWRDRKGPWLHGWIYGLEDGLLRELVAVEPNSPLPAAHRIEF
jgi:carbonic anhydrase